MSRPRELALSKMSRWVGDLVAARRVTPWQPDGRLVLLAWRKGNKAAKRKSKRVKAQFKHAAHTINLLLSLLRLVSWSR